MRSVTKTLASAAVAAALIVTPTAAVSATASAPLAAQPQNSWTTLSQMTPAGAVALAGGGAVTPSAATMAAAAAQTSDYPSDYRRNGLPLPAIAVLLAVFGVAIYIAFIEKHRGKVNFPFTPVSPN